MIGLVVIYLIAEHQYDKPKQNELFFRMAIIFAGLLMELSFRFFGLTDYPSIEYFVPSWLFLVWLSFGLTFHGCYRWLSNYSIWYSVILGGFFGPLTYWIASKLAPFQILEPITFTVTSSLFWALLYLIAVKSSTSNSRTANHIAV